ncbi:MAG: sulfotransferase family protein [Armatimonadota bacterium]
MSRNRAPRGRRSQLALLARQVATVPGRLDRWLYLAGLRSARGLTLPHFLGIGAQKAGTSWLDRNLRYHPELFLPEEKELHYFDRHWGRSLRWYARWFEAAGDRLPGEITPAYGVLPPDRIRLVRSLLPDARLIFIMRDPVERAWSHVQMHYWMRRRKKVEEIGRARLLKALQRPGLIARSSYSETLDQWTAVYPAEQLYVGFFDDIAERPQELLREIFRHLGVREEIEWERLPLREVVRRGGGAPMPPEVRELLEARCAPELERLEARFGARVGRWRSS